jgi:hypothetical protein
MNRRDATLPDSDELIAQAQDILGDVDSYAHNCHGASLALVRAGIAPKCRVARGSCQGVGGQHSWVVLGMDCYNTKATIIDPTLWSYCSDVHGIYVGDQRKHSHRPHGAGSIWKDTAGYPPFAGDLRGIPLAVSVSRRAMSFLSILAPDGHLDRRQWSFLASAPVGGWPAVEIITAMDDTPTLSPLVPIDRLGMLTDRNPGGLYLPTAGAER